MTDESLLDTIRELRDANFGLHEKIARFERVYARLLAEPYEAEPGSLLDHEDDIILGLAKCDLSRSVPGATTIRKPTGMKGFIELTQVERSAVNGQPLGGPIAIRAADVVLVEHVRAVIDGVDECTMVATDRSGVGRLPVVESVDEVTKRLNARLAQDEAGWMYEPNTSGLSDEEVKAAVQEFFDSPGYRSYQDAKISRLLHRDAS